MNNSVISSFLWDIECTKLFCGYKNGAVDVVYVPHQTKEIFQIPSENILKLEKQSVVQMDFIKDTLLVSTTEKVMLINLQTKFSILIGTKPRSGQFGACFWLGEAKNLKVIAARPNYRLWIASSDGTVEETHQYKNCTNSSKYRIRKSDIDSQGSGQFYWLSAIKNNLIFAGDSGGLILVIDLILKLCLITIDCGANLTKTVFSNLGVMILNCQREIVNISIMTMNEALLKIINEDIEPRYAIDLFLSLNLECDDDKAKNQDLDIRNIFNNFTPNLLTLIVEKAAELEYRFVETNKLQVEIRDNDEYQKLYCSIRGDGMISIIGDNINNPSLTNSTVELSNDLSMESDKTQSSDKSKIMARAPKLLKTIYDKTSKYISQMDIISSSNSELHFSSMDSFSLNSKEDANYDVGLTFKQSCAQHYNENVNSEKNIMELEANMYIAWERMKCLGTTDGIKSRDDFFEALSNFCESWLTLNLQHWQKLYFVQLDLLNLSASFPNFSPKSKEGLDYFESSIDTFVPYDEMNYLYTNSWCNPIHVSEWKKPLPVPEKIGHMTSTLLSHCFYYRIYPLFPDLIMNICDLNNIEKLSYQMGSSDTDVEISDGINDKSTQTYDCIANSITENSYKYSDLLDLLNNEIWPKEPDCLWIKSMILLFHSVTNLKDLRNWITSCISHDVWLTILYSFKEIYSVTLSKEEYQYLSNKSQLELEKLLFNCLCLDSIESLVLSDEIIGCMNQRKQINWKIIIESENLDCRNVLHLSIKHDIDLSDYIVYLFNSVSASSKFYSRHHISKHVYSEPDVLISFVYTLLNNSKRSADVEHKICPCGMIIVYSDTNLSEDMYNIAIDLIKWGSDQNMFKSNDKLLGLLTKICIDMGFHRGYIELLVGTSDVQKLIHIGIQTSYIQILERIKDCSIISSQSIKDAIEFLIKSRRKQVKDQCISCSRQFENCDTTAPLLSWKDLGHLIFKQLLERNVFQEIQQSVIKMFNANEIKLVKEYLVAAIIDYISAKKVVVNNQMLRFINTEMNKTDDGYKLTELYLNIFSMNHSELCGLNWGKILTQNMICNVCSAVLIGKQWASDKSEIVAFNCGHSFHKNCLVDIGCESFCFMC